MASVPVDTQKAHTPESRLGNGCIRRVIGPCYCHEPDPRGRPPKDYVVLQPRRVLGALLRPLPQPQAVPRPPWYGLCLQRQGPHARAVHVILESDPPVLSLLRVMVDACV